MHKYEIVLEVRSSDALTPEEIGALVAGEVANLMPVTSVKVIPRD